MPNLEKKIELSLQSIFQGLCKFIKIEIKFYQKSYEKVTKLVNLHNMVWITKKRDLSPRKGFKVQQNG